MLDQQLAAQLKAYLERVTQPFELVASLDEGKSSTELRSLLEQIAGMSDKITLRTDGNDARKPSFSLQRQGTDTQLRFAAIPLGHELPRWYWPCCGPVAIRRRKAKRRCRRSAICLANTTSRST